MQSAHCTQVDAPVALGFLNRKAGTIMTMTKANIVLYTINEVIAKI
jgi:hypothetical protein